MFSTICFLLFAAICVISAFTLLFSRHPINGAMALVLNMLSLAGIYALVNSTFLGVLQILVYAGAVMMLIVFVIMVLNGAKETRLPRMDRLGLCSILSVFSGALLLIAAFYNVDLQENATAVNGSVAMVSEHLFDISSRSGELMNVGGGYFILFQLTGLILLSAMVSAVLLAKRKNSLGKNEQR
ncbi:MAG: NADH-quinone oxidoreductase subunit J [Fibromonadaceae bacterium]|jgi:NADH-quinone oxidoreductase subunit J|nr:NADH-quinone oxidoreductase subunit J [Fibromonadaceae bacterium]